MTSFCFEFCVVGCILVLGVSMVVVLRVFNVPTEGLEEWDHDCSVSIAMISSCHGSHHAANLDFIHTVCVGLNDSALLNFACANEGDLMKHRAERGNGSGVAQ